MKTSGILILTTLLYACGSTGETPEPEQEPMFEQAMPRPGSAPGPWTTAFEHEAVLIARRVIIEGPSDLLEHVVIRQEPNVFDLVQETTTQGLKQTLTRKSDALGEIRAWLDLWTVVAMDELVVLQRPGEVPVKVTAVGEAVYQPTSGGDPVRKGRLEFTGQRGR